MPTSYSVRLEKIVAEHELTVAYRATDYDRVCIDNWDVSRPALPLAGFYDYFDAGRVQVIGKLEITRSSGEAAENENNDLVRVTYAIEPMDLEAYGREGLAEELAEKDLLRNERFRDWFYQILERTGCPETERDLAADLMEAFFRYYEEGILADHKKEILMNPVYPVMIDALWDTNYGPWMKATLETTARNAGSVEISYLMENADKLPVR